MPTDTSTTPPAIPDYELLRLIGRGAYGEVWLARGLTGIYRAVKIVWRDRFPEASPYEREFHGLKEFAAISLSESRQLALLHVGRDRAAGYFYYVMELADDVASGREIHPEHYVPHTLKEVRQRRGRLPAAECLGFAVELARALATLHARGLVHRDIKPSNVIIVGGAPKLADIGLVTAASAGLTFVGTEGFVPPEGPGAPAADVFGLGKLLYELLTGLDRHDYPRLPADLHTWPDRKAALELNEVLIRACEPHPDKRHRDATALLDDLLLLQAGRSVRQLRRTERRLSRALRVVALLALVAAVAGTGAYLERQRADEETTARRAAEAERDALASQAVYAAALAQAQRALDQEDLGRARQLLEGDATAGGDPTLRGFEWHALWREAQGDLAEILRAAGPGINRVAISPDGHLAAVHDEGARLVLFDLRQGREILVLKDILRLGGFSPDGQWIIGCARNLSLQRWRVADGVAEPPLAPGTNRLAGISPVGTAVVFTDDPGAAAHTVRGWDLENKVEQWRWPVAGSDATRPDYFRATLSPDGKWVALVLIHGRGSAAHWELRVAQADTGAVLFQEPRIDRLTALAFSPDSTSLAVANSARRELALLDLPAKSWRWRTQVGRSQMDTVSFSPDGQRVSTGGRDARLYLLSAQDGTVLAEKRGQAAGITAISWRKTDASLLVAGNGGDIRHYASTTPSAAPELGGLWTPQGGGRRVCLSSDGRWLAATLDGKSVRLHAVTAPADTRVVTGMFAPVAFASDGRRLLGITPERRLGWYDLSTAQMETVAGETALPNLSNALGTSTALDQLAIPDYTGALFFWDLTKPEPLKVAQAHVGGALWATLSPDGTLAASGGQDLFVRLWSPRTGQPLGSARSEAAVTGCIGPDGRWLVLGLRNGSFEVRSLPDLSLRHTIRTTSATLIDVVASAQGDRLFAAGTNGTVHVFSTQDWREITALHVQTAGVVETTIDRLALSADNQTLAAYTNDGRVRWWRK